MEYLPLFTAAALLAFVSEPSASLPAQAVGQTTLQPLADNRQQSPQKNYEALILNGTPTEVNEFPMMAGLVDLYKGVYCGATLVSAYYVLTAAHCLTPYEPDDVAVLVGEHDFSTGAETPATALVIAKEFIIHPEFDYRNKVNNIALVRLWRPVDLSAQVYPVCLPFELQRETLTGMDLTVLGWGRTSSGGERSELLLTTQLAVLDQDTCQAAYRHKHITDEQLCTIAENTDVCKGDSGGPLLWWNADLNIHVLVGVVSYDVGCDSSWPTINTRVDPYLGWIHYYTGVSFCGN